MAKLRTADDGYTVGQLRHDLKRLIDYCSLRLAGTPTNEERIFYKARRSTLEEVFRITKNMQDQDAGDSHDYA